MERSPLKGKVAAALQQVVRDFLLSLRWELQEQDEHTLLGTRVLGGNTLRWCIHFEDARSFSITPPSPSDFAPRLVQKAQQNHFFDLIGPEEVFASRHWLDYIRPTVDRRFTGNPNWRYGTTKEFLNRFAADVTAAHEKRVDQVLKRYFIQKPVNPSFIDNPDALATTIDWLVSPQKPRLMLIRGDAGGGKSIFSLMLVTELQARFKADPSRYPAPFLIWFSNERPAALKDLITLTLSDLGLSDSLTPDSIRSLLKQGRLLLILDGFDEVSRALADNARQNVEELSQDINKRTLGKLILTSRPSFIDQEEIFSDLKHGCEEELHEERELAPYTDAQMREWVLQNAPKDKLQGPPESHWQRISTAFNRNPELRDICRTPVFLRMLSEVLVKEKSVASLYDLVEKFCREMWERERGKRTLSLSDAQYCYAYEAVAALVQGETVIDPRQVKATLELYLEEYAPELIAGMPAEAGTLVADLAIGPLTYGVGVFTFSHEVLQAYFTARLLARSLSAKRKVDDLWNRRIGDAEWRFLPPAVGEIGGKPPSPATFIDDLVRRTRSGLVAWNILRALKCQPRELARDIFAGKDLAGVVFDGTDLRGMVFDRCVLYDVTFDRANMSNTTFRDCTISKIRFVECGRGAIFDENPRLAEDAEIRFVRSRESGTELYVGADIVRFLGELAGREIASVEVPINLAEQAILVVIGSLFKADQKRFDYPERAKIENRLRGWLREFRFREEQARKLVKIFAEMVEQLEDKRLIVKNDNRPRTLMPGESWVPGMVEAMRKNTTKGLGRVVEEIISAAQAKCN